VPGNDVLEQHARQVMTRALTNKALDTVRPQAKSVAASVTLPSDLHRLIVAALQRQPDIPWDLTVAHIARKVLDGNGLP